MQSPIVIAFMAGIVSAFTPTEVKEDLDAHPWRPAPSAPIAKTAPAVVPESVRSSVEPGKAPPMASAAPAMSSTSGIWQLQMAALSSPDAAKVEQKRLEKILGAGKIEIVADGSVNRLRYGSFSSKEAAEAARDDLKTKGLEGFLVKKP